MNGNHILKWKIYRTFFLLGPKDYRNFLSFFLSFFPLFSQHPDARWGQPGWRPVDPRGARTKDLILWKREPTVIDVQAKNFPTSARMPDILTHEVPRKFHQNRCKFRWYRCKNNGFPRNFPTDFRIDGWLVIMDAMDIMVYMDDVDYMDLMDLMDLMDHMAFMDAGAAHKLRSFWLREHVY